MPLALILVQWLATLELFQTLQLGTLGFILTLKSIQTRNLSLVLQLRNSGIFLDFTAWDFWVVLYSMA